MNNGVSYTSTKPLEEFEINKKNKPSDLISREQAIEEIKSVFEWHDVVTVDRLVEHIKALQSQQKTGKWTIEDCHAATYKYCCSECNAHHRARYDFCPTCGARMECGGEE